jgi:hypothetical protein
MLPASTGELGRSTTSESDRLIARRLVEDYQLLRSGVNVPPRRHWTLDCGMVVAFPVLWPLLVVGPGGPPMSAAAVRDPATALAFRAGLTAFLRRIAQPNIIPPDLLVAYVDGAVCDWVLIGTLFALLPGYNLATLLFVAGPTFDRMEVWHEQRRISLVTGNSTESGVKAKRLREANRLHLAMGRGGPKSSLSDAEPSDDDEGDDADKEFPAGVRSGLGLKTGQPAAADVSRRSALAPDPPPQQGALARVPKSPKRKQNRGRNRKRGGRHTQKPASSSQPKHAAATATATAAVEPKPASGPKPKAAKPSAKAARPVVKAGKKKATTSAATSPDEDD